MTSDLDLEDKPIVWTGAVRLLQQKFAKYHQIYKRLIWVEITLKIFNALDKEHVFEKYTLIKCQDLCNLILFS